VSTHEEYPGYSEHKYTTTWLMPRWLVPMLVLLFLLSTVGAIGGGWYIAHRLDVDTVDDS